MHSFFWHDYETFGAQPRRDRPAQFAGVRTDADLNEIAAPVMFYCQPAPDYLPHPHACLLTGITPQWCQQHGLAEPEFAARIQAELGQSATIGVGYNSIRFDDEITRHMFWRNLMDPYAREWQDQCGRWDLMDVMRLTYALRPEGIVWPSKSDGTPSFTLEDLARANGLLHEKAHDALSDVRATIALARLVRQHQPRLFEFALGLRKKDRVLQELHLSGSPSEARPFLHVSGMFSPERGCLAVMWPLACHPTNKNEVLAWDLAHDPSELAHLSTDDIRQRLFTRHSDLPAGVRRLPLKTIHINKSPMVVGNVNTLSPAQAQRWGVDWAAIAQHVEAARHLPNLQAVWQVVYQRPEHDLQALQASPADVEQDLYSGFLSTPDRRHLDRLRTLAAQDPQAFARAAQEATAFQDARLPELVFRYRARHFGHTLSSAEQQRWHEHCRAVLVQGQGGGLAVQAFFDLIDPLMEQAEERNDSNAQEILSALYDWAELVTAAL